jgi:RNA binding exosome subunit
MSIKVTDIVCFMQRNKKNIYLMLLMNNILYIKIRVFAKPEEDINLIEKTFINLIPEEHITKNKYEKINAKSFNERKIIIFETIIEKNKFIKEFLEKLFSNLNIEQKELLIKQINYRINENKFNLRLEKKDLLENKYFITNYGDCFNIIIGIANYPGKTIEEKVKELIEIFK